LSRGKIAEEKLLTLPCTIAVEHWLRRLQRADGSPLADTTKAKIRSLFSVLFNHAIRYEWLDQGRNPITLVRQSAKRKRTPEVWNRARSRTFCWN